MENLKNSIVVLPYKETNRLFNASKTVECEAYIGENGTVYYEHQAKLMTFEEANSLAFSVGNEKAYVKQLN